MAVITGLATTTPGFPSLAPPPPTTPSPPFPPGTPLGRLRPLPQRWPSAESVMVERQIRHRIDRCTAAAAAWEPKVKVAVVVAVCGSDWPFGRCRCRGCVSHCRANSIAALHQWQPPGTLITRVSVCVIKPLRRHFGLTNCVCSAVKNELLALGVGSGWLNHRKVCSWSRNPPNRLNSPAPETRPLPPNQLWLYNPGCSITQTQGREILAPRHAAQPRRREAASFPPVCLHHRLC